MRRTVLIAALAACCFPTLAAAPAAHSASRRDIEKQAKAPAVASASACGTESRTRAVRSALRGDGEKSMPANVAPALRGLASGPQAGLPAADPEELNAVRDSVRVLPSDHHRARGLVPLRYPWRPPWL